MHGYEYKKFHSERKQLFFRHENKISQKWLFIFENEIGIIVLLFYLSIKLLNALLLVKFFEVEFFVSSMVVYLYAFSTVERE